MEQDNVTYLSKEGDKAVAQKTVDGSPVSEKRAVIPPTLIGSLKLKVSLVLHHL